jgi:hypothetical protein
MLLRCSDPHLSAEDIALGYKQHHPLWLALLLIASPRPPPACTASTPP